MAQKKRGKAPARQRELSLEEKENIAAEVLGVHPKFLLKETDQILRLAIWEMQAAGFSFTGFKHRTIHDY